MDELALQLHRIFGDVVQARFVNMIDKEARGLTEIRAMLRKGEACLPIVMINGEVKFSGNLSVSEISSAVDGVIQRG